MKTIIVSTLALAAQGLDLLMTQMMTPSMMAQTTIGDCPDGYSFDDAICGCTTTHPTCLSDEPYCLYDEASQACTCSTQNEY